jgi:rubrerythrin
MFTTDEDSIESLAESVFGKKLGLAYDGPIYSCSVCGTPCSGVMCLSCATRG